MDRLHELIREIHRRSLWQVLGIYVVASWAVLQAVETLTSTLTLPDWFPPFAFVLLLIGLPIVLATAFVQEGGPGSDRSHADPAAPAPRATGLFTWQNAIAGGVLAFALWGVVAAGWLVFGDRFVPGAEEDPSVAVLPFANISIDPDDAYFAAGVHAEIITHLTRIASLKVISRPSVLEYAGREKNVREIASELEVDHLLYGTVQRDRDRVHIQVQLINARTDDGVWAETYDRDISDVFAVQADVAERVTEELGARLAPSELARIESPPTQDEEAYALYLRALEFPIGDERRVRLLEQAIARDPDFALAHAYVAESYIGRYWWEDRTEENLRASEAALDRALELDSSLPQVHYVAGRYHYWGRRDYLTAFREYTLAAEGLPNDAEVHERLGDVLRRSGRWEEAVSSYEKAVELNPRSTSARTSLGQTQALMRRFEDAEATFARLEALQGYPNAYAVQGLALWRGDGQRAEQMLDRHPEENRVAFARYLYAQALLLQRDYERAAEVLDGVSNLVRPNNIWLRSLFLGEIYGLLGQPDLATAHYDSARVYLEEEAGARPSDDRVFGALGIAYAGLGRPDDAVEAALESLELAPPERDAFQGLSRILDLATVYVMVGDFDAALEQLEWLLENPSTVNVGRLRAEPRWDPIREDAGFRALLEKF